MKNRSILIVISMIALMLAPMALARKGVGVVWDTETEIVVEGSTHCVQYGIYNPWDEDVTALLSVSDELKDIIIKEESESKLITGETMHDMAVPIEFCFDIAKVYEEDCLIGGLICEQTCGEEQVIYEGKIVAMEGSTGGGGGAAGSATALGVSVPLKLKVRCFQHARDWTIVYVTVLIVALLIVGYMLYKRKPKKKK
jgi:hypothetical protein